MAKDILVFGSSSFINMQDYDCLIQNGYQVDFVNKHEAAQFKLSSKDYDLIIIDSPLKDSSIEKYKDDFKKAAGNLPIVVVTDNIEDKIIIKSLNFGASYYLHKPINPKTFPAMIAAFLRKEENFGQAHFLTNGPFTFDEGNLTFSKNGDPILLTKKESILIKVFMDHPNQVFTVEELFKFAWRKDTPDKNTIMVYINRLRQKIEDDAHNPKYLKNVRGQGYMFKME